MPPRRNQAVNGRDRKLVCLWRSVGGRDLLPQSQPALTDMRSVGAKVQLHVGR